MRGGQIALLVVFLLVNQGNTPSALAKEVGQVAGIRMPPGARSLPEGRYSSSLGFKKSVVYFERYLRSRSLSHTQVPTTELRGVLLSRFLSDLPSSAWLAIHVYQVKGVTLIVVVPRQDESVSIEKPSSP